MAELKERRKNAELTYAQQIWEYVQETDGPFTALDVQEYVGCSKPLATNALAILCVAGLLSKRLIPGRGNFQYTLKETT